jgi:PIN domain nuclease of toxin-antitoxin system
MRLLLDTHILLWMSDQPTLLSRSARDLLGDSANQLHFSPVNIWEIAVKNAAGRPDFEVDTRAFRNELAQRGFIELPVTSEHALAIGDLPLLHKDPFDRMLVAQATVEGVILLTADARLARYPGPIQKV